MMRLYGLYGVHIDKKKQTNTIIKIYYLYANRQENLNYVSEI